MPTNPGEPTPVRGGSNSVLGLGIGMPFRRMKSMERWKAGGGWFDRSRERDERERDRDREREREERARGLGGWI